MAPVQRVKFVIFRAFALCVALVLCATGSGCSVMMASKAPPKKDLSILHPGVSRNMVISELGAPQTSTKAADGTTTDVYDFKQGYTDTTRGLRVGGHLAADILTTCLWELVGTPLEMSLQGTTVRTEVVFDQTDHAQRIEYFKGAYLRDGRANSPSWWREASPQTALLEAPQRPDSAIRHASAAAPAQEKTAVEHAN